MLLVVWLLSSKALIDYTSSGLEYPLSYFLIALFYVRYFDAAVRVPPTVARTALLRARRGAGIRQSVRHGAAVRHAARRDDALEPDRATDARDVRAAPGRRVARRPAGCCSRRSTTASRCRIPTTPRSPTAFQPGCSTSRAGRISSTASATIRSRSAPSRSRRCSPGGRRAPARRATLSRAAVRRSTRFRSAAIS